MIYNGLNGDNYKSGNDKLSNKPSSDSWTMAKEEGRNITKHVFM